MQEQQEKGAKDFAEVAKRLASKVRTEGVHAEGLLSDCGVEGEVNCYPGTPGASCHRVAFFISLQSEKHAKGSGHLSFQKMLAALVSHMEGSCKEPTLCAVIITDNWDVRAWEEWSDDIAKIKAKKLLMAYLIMNGQEFEMPV